MSSAQQHLILTSRDPLGILERYLAAGFLKPIENFIEGPSHWESGLVGADRLRYEAVVAGIRQLQSLEAVHGIGAAIDIEHPFTVKILRLNERKQFLPDPVVSNARIYYANHRGKQQLEDSAR